MQSREILFRAKTKISDAFAYSYFAQMGDGPHIILKGGALVPVHPATIGQFTGYLDGAGRKIYEGDIVENTSAAHDIGIVRWYHGICDSELGPLYGDTFTGFAIEWKRRCYRSDIAYWHRRHQFFRIIGNIHDNPELLLED